MRIMQILLTVIVLLSLLLANTACQKETAIRKAAKASYQLSGLTLDAVRTTKQAYNEQLITLEQKDKLADSLLVVIRGGQSFNAAVKAAVNVYGESGDIPATKWDELKAAFGSEVVNPFVTFLEQVKVVKLSPQMKVAIDVLRTTILTIADAFGQRESVQATLAQTTVKFYRKRKSEVMIYG